MNVSSYHNSLLKRTFDLFFSLFFLIVLFPLAAVISVFIKVTSKGKVLFFQKRVGKDGQIFSIIKFRTMKKGAEANKKKFSYLNESDGPAFKIRNDPRFTKFGKVLSHTGLDELPQLINVMRGEMSIVGPRPLPIDEAKKLSKKERVRELVLPGITSTWVTKGSHRLTFKKWMQLDAKYVKNASFFGDLGTIFSTFFLIIRYILKLT